ncbi:MAG TPA: dTDP-4-dehydrorhamnose 3,5-epimerase [Candidatus Saccharimonadales bacterium]|jgi:dTDP-4-dehydrorhamnose 3,5-epimerase|nr:dTDP-4-dehydrorhamnose 3,5-epimerase [Candidatus Saccharimonadales bacterium]
MPAELAVRATEISGMFVVDLVLHGDQRGWFKENYQRAKMEALGLPHFEAVQNNFSFNAEKGVTRGLHAEPWEKYISLANGRVFGAWVDLRPENFGKVFTLEITPEVGVFVPRGVANGYQTLEENITYTYLVNAHWSHDAQYASANLFDPQLGINWPIPQDQAIISDKDRTNPLLKDVRPMEFK